jgi:hypothetical protein
VIAPEVAEFGDKPVLPPLNVLTTPVPEAIALCTNAVVAICVVFVPVDAVVDVGVPESAGLFANTTAPVPVVDALEADVALPYASNVTVGRV